MSVTLFGATHGTWSKPDEQWEWGRIGWLVVTVISTFYTFYWDVKMDWKLFPSGASKEDNPKIHPILGKNSLSLSLSIFAYVRRELFNLRALPLRLEVGEKYERFLEGLHPMHGRVSWLWRTGAGLPFVIWRRR